jgi:hypothetical protein
MQESRKIIVKQKLGKVVAWLAGLFIIILLLKVLISFFPLTPANPQVSKDLDKDFFSSIENLPKNYASERSATSIAVNEGVFSTDERKYEKVAYLKTTSPYFDKDEKELKKIVARFGGIVQYEKKLGLENKRELHLLIGINPECFDSFLLSIKKIGSVEFEEITKTDKTTEYKKLKAKQSSIEKGFIVNEIKRYADKKVAGPNNIILINPQDPLPDVTVDLENFNGKNDLCTTKLSLFETARNIHTFPNTTELLKSTLHVYLILLFMLLTFFVFKLLEKNNVLKIVLPKT